MEVGPPEFVSVEESEIATEERSAAPAGASDGTRRPTRSLAGRRSRGGDGAFAGLTKASGILILVIMAAVAAFLIYQAVPAIAKDRANFFTAFAWSPDAPVPMFGIGALAFGSVLVSVIALIIGVPVAVGVALFISQYAPRAIARPLAYIVDLLAAVPSVVFGLWGVIFLVPHMVPLSRVLSRYLGWTYVFANPNQTFGKSMLAGGVVLAVMVLPIVAALSREVFVQTPKDQLEGAIALGATKWETIRMTVLPYGRSGVISAVVLGFGRAIGETIAVALVLAATNVIDFRILMPGGNAISANIANVWQDAGPTGQGALIASGLVLFAITLVVNFGARAIVRRGNRKAGL